MAVSQGAKRLLSDCIGSGMYGIVIFNEMHCMPFFVQASHTLLVYHTRKYLVPRITSMYRTG